MILLGIHGKRGVGKDTLAEALQNKIKGATCVALADRLKEACSLLFDVPLIYFYDQSLKESTTFNGRTPRQIMIDFDLALTPVFGKATYTKVMQGIIDRNRLKLPALIVTDIRGEEEAHFIRANGGAVVHVRRPNMPVRPAIDHWTEQGIAMDLDDIAVVIHEGLHHVQQTADNIIYRYQQKMQSIALNNS